MKRSKNKKRIVIAAAVLLAFWLTAAVTVEAKDAYPAKPISIIVPYAPGGSLDIAARTLAVYMGQYLKTSIVITNIPGAGGAIGTTKGYTAAPDGYTLVCWYTLPPLLEEYKHKVGYKTLNFTPVAGISRDFPIIVGHPEGSKTIQDFVKQGKEKSVNIGGNGQYSITGLQGRLMSEELGMKVNWVNYGGAAESLTSLAGRHLDGVATMTESAMPLIRSGKIIPLLIFAKDRHPRFPSIPVPGELGYKFPLISSYLSIVGPPGMEKAKVKILEDAIMKAAKHPDYIAWRDKVSTAEPALASARAYQAELARFAKVAEDYKSFLIAK